MCFVARSCTSSSMLSRASSTITAADPWQSRSCLSRRLCRFSAHLAGCVAGGQVEGQAAGKLVQAAAAAGHNVEALLGQLQIRQGRHREVAREQALAGWQEARRLCGCRHAATWPSSARP